jgi:hypothetical protein
MVFIRDLAERHPHRAIKYCELILSGRRRWDPSVDVSALHVWITDFLPSISRSGNGPMRERK